MEYIASLGKSGDESKKIKEAVRTSAYGSTFVQAALSVNKKVQYFTFITCNNFGQFDVIMVP